MEVKPGLISSFGRKFTGLKGELVMVKRKISKAIVRKKKK